MKLKFFSLVCFMALFSAKLFAQDAATVTDEELKKYAIAMDSVNEMQAVLSGQIKEMVTTSQTISAQRYNELFKVINDEGKLLEANATPEEIAFVKEVIAKKDAGTAKIKETYQLLAKDFVGAAAFNKVRKAISSDEGLKTKYQSLMDELAKDNAVN
ncbi:hypothetical protein ACFQ21_27335 [Ohtaekwangia kribbensis]|jgi:hypothetical protein|uniref:DUF4168 domain-containing protein n=1 Tax=Ohtaekwangia kribbensis TaxID=688913 RepID=A0ABW3K9W8_9BACT